MEMAQCMARFGAQTAVISHSASALRKEDVEAAAIVQAQLARDGVTFFLSINITSVRSLPGE